MSTTAEIVGGDVVVECELDAPPEKVWQALTVPELVTEWLEVEPAAAGGETGYAVTEARPHSYVRYEWRDETSSRPVSFVTFELSPCEGGRTHFRLTHRATATALCGANTNRPPTMALAA
jgi:uncharacterized protein YndB with AHSA1/START domain